MIQFVWCSCTIQEHGVSAPKYTRNRMNDNFFKNSKKTKGLSFFLHHTCLNVLLSWRKITFDVLKRVNKIDTLKKLNTLKSLFLKHFGLPFFLPKHHEYDLFMKIYKYRKHSRMFFHVKKKIRFFECFCYFSKFIVHPGANAPGSRMTVSHYSYIIMYNLPDNNCSSRCGGSFRSDGPECQRQATVARWLQSAEVNKSWMCFKWT